MSDASPKPSKTHFTERPSTPIHQLLAIMETAPETWAILFDEKIAACTDDAKLFWIQQKFDLERLLSAVPTLIGEAGAWRGSNRNGPTSQLEDSEEAKLLRALLASQKQTRTSDDAAPPKSHREWYIRRNRTSKALAEKIAKSIDGELNAEIQHSGTTLLIKTSAHDAPDIVGVIDYHSGSDTGIIMELRDLQKYDAEQFSEAIRQLRQEDKYSLVAKSRRHTTSNSAGLAIELGDGDVVADLLVTAANKFTDIKLKKKTFTPKYSPQPDDFKPRRQVNPRSSFVSYGDVNPVKENQPKAEDGGPVGTPAL